MADTDYVKISTTTSGEDWWMVTKQGNVLNTAPYVSKELVDAVFAAGTGNRRVAGVEVTNGPSSDLAANRVALLLGTKTEGDQNPVVVTHVVMGNKAYKLQKPITIEFNKSEPRQGAVTDESAGEIKQLVEGLRNGSVKATEVNDQKSTSAVNPHFDRMLESWTSENKAEQNFLLGAIAPTPPNKSLNSCGKTGNNIG